MATSLLQYTAEFGKSIIVRTRDQSILDQLDIQCDVGGVYDPEKRRFDHHQKTFTTHWWEEKDKAAEAEKKEGENPEARVPTTKLSSAGLIYKFYGKEIIKNMCKEFYEKDLNDEQVELIYEKLYKVLILEIDAIDNGVNQADETKYSISTNLSSRVGVYNSPWNAPQGAQYSQHAQFKKSMKITEQAFVHKLYGQVNIVLPAKEVVKEAWDSRESFHASKQFIWFEKSCPWKEHVYELEKSTEQEGLIKFAFFKDGRGMFRVQAVSKNASSFENRVSLCKAYRGLRGDELNKVSALPDCEFVHAAGFIGGAWSKESAIKMAENSLAEFEQEQKSKEDKS